VRAPAFVVATVCAAACNFHDASSHGATGDGGATPTGDAGSRDATADARGDAMVDASSVVMAPRLVQQTQGYMASGSPLSAAFAVRPSANDVLIMVGAAEHGGLATVTGGGATWARAARSLTNSNIEIWYGTTDGSSGTVTITFAGTNPYPLWLVVTEWSGLATTSALDNATATAGGGANASAGTIATTNANDLVVFGVADSAPNSWGTPGPGAWSGLQQVSSQVITQAAWYRLVSATGSYAPQVAQTASSWDAAVAAFRAAP